MTTIDPQKLKRQRRERRRGGRAGAPTEIEFAQGRAQPMVRLEELPDPVDAPDAHGPLSEEEEERWELCQRSFQQFQQAWWVAAKALDIALRGRLWRRDYDTAEEFIKDTAGMSKSNAYRQIAGASVAALVAAPHNFELESNDESRMRDSSFDPDSNKTPDTESRPLVISQRAAEALTHVREDYGAEAAAAAYRTVAEVTGRDKVSQKTITGIVQQLPRKEDEELSENGLTERVRALAHEQAEKEAAAKETASDPLQDFRAYVGMTREFAHKTRGMAAAYKKAAKADQAKADRLATQMRDHMARAAQNFPNI